EVERALGEVADGRAARGRLGRRIRLGGRGWRAGRARTGSAGRGERGEPSTEDHLAPGPPSWAGAGSLAGCAGGGSWAWPVFAASPLLACAGKAACLPSSSLPGSGFWLSLAPAGRAALGVPPGPRRPIFSLRARS